MDDNQLQAVLHAANKLFHKSWFCICDLQAIMKVTGAQETADYDYLRLYHCTHYRDMTEQQRAWVFKVAIENIANTEMFPAIKIVNPFASSQTEEKPAVIESGKSGMVTKLIAMIKGE